MDAEYLQAAKNRVAELLPTRLFAQKAVVYVNNEPSTIGSYSESEILSFCAGIGVVRWKYNSLTDNIRRLHCIRSKYSPASYFHPKWRQIDSAALRIPRVYVVFNSQSVVSIMDGVIHGIAAANYGYDDVQYYKYSVSIGCRRFEDEMFVWIVDDVRMPKADFDSYGLRVDVILEPFLIGPLRMIVGGYLPFF
jgi:hypothetical protein